MIQPMPQNKVQVPRISDAVASSLERRILEGSLKPGDRLPPERELAIELGVSRPSLREAIQKLASKGMVQSRQGGGTYVTDRLESSFFDPWQDMMGRTPICMKTCWSFVACWKVRLPSGQQNVLPRPI
jgi:GntR family transcriptional repressor for pyruvate dehydrogenase complex